MSGSTALVRLTESMLWDLRAAWGSGKRVAVTLDPERTDLPRRLEGHVQHVSPTGAFAVIDRRHVPAELIAAVHSPSILADSTYRNGRWHGDPLAPVQIDGQLELGEAA